MGIASGLQEFDDAHQGGFELITAGVRPAWSAADPGGAAQIGELSAEDAWARLREDQDAQLVDVRSQPEWTFVGVPDLSDLGKSVQFIEWQSYPGMAPNTEFFRQLSAALGDGFLQKPLLFLCRTGGRSAAAAHAALELGASEPINVLGGFEGALDAENHRGAVSGWKAANLPWRQS